MTALPRASAVAGGGTVARRRPLAEIGRIEMGALQVLLGIILVGGWHFASGTLINDFYISNPRAVFVRIVEWMADGSLLRHTWSTTYETLLGFAIGALVGIVLGFWLGVHDFASRVLHPFLLFFFALPKPALAPLLILWFGFGPGSKIALAALLVFFLVFYNTYSGVREVDRDYVDVVRLMNGRPNQVFMKVIVPSALTWVLAGVQVSVPFALIGAIVGEMLAANQGLGYLVQYAGAEFDTAGVFAALIAIAVLAVALNKVVDLVEAALQPWKRGSSGTSDVRAMRSGPTNAGGPI